MGILLPETFLYTFANKEFYEPLDRYEPNVRDFISIARRHLPPGWQFSRRSIWYSCSPPHAAIPQQGWKIHLSAVLEHAHGVLETATRFLARAEVPFKFALDRPMFLLLQSKRWNRGGAGKFITIYPRDVEHCRQLLDG